MLELLKNLYFGIKIKFGGNKELEIEPYVKGMESKADEDKRKGTINLKRSK